MLLAAAIFALVTQDPTALRAAPSNSAPKNAILWQGDALEVRGARAGYLQVYDHRRERAGYVLESSVRQYPLETTRAAALLETVRFLRDVPGLEALGIGHAALYLKVAEPREIDGEVFDALATMADRLARRASSSSARTSDGAFAGQLDVARSYGVRFESVETDGLARTCYDGEAFRQVLALTRPEAPGAADALARAALGLTRPGCATGTEAERLAANERATEALDRVPLDSLPPLVRNRVRLRRASVWSSLAHGRARRGQIDAAQAAERRALDEIALVPRAELAESDSDAVADAFLRTAAARPASDSSTAPVGGLQLRSAARAPGETCLTLFQTKTAGEKALVERCTYAVVWSSSARYSPNGSAVAVAIQPLDGWRELLVFRQVAGEWSSEVVSPATEVGLGYVEWAGWTPDGKGLLVPVKRRSEARWSAASSSWTSLRSRSHAERNAREI